MSFDFSDIRHEKAGIPSIQYIYRDKDGKPVLVANRYDKPDGKKFFLPFDVERRVWKAPEIRPIYNLDKIMAADPATPVILVEGEKCADSLSGLGYIATTTFGGCNGFKKADLSPLENRIVYIWPDFDDPGKTYADKIANILYIIYKVTARIIPITPAILHNVYIGGKSPIYDKGWDAADAVAAGWTKDPIDILLSKAVPYEPQPDNSKSEPTLDMGNIDLWHTPEKEAFATLKVGSHFENWALSSATFRNMFSRDHYLTEGKYLSQTSFEDCRRAMMGEALYGGNKHKVFTRIAGQGKSVFVDLGNEDWNALVINSAGWQVLDHPPVRFLRSSAMQALPIPMPGAGNIELLRPFLNVASDTDFRMLVAWLIGCFHPRGPYPILILTGEQGSAKSTTAKALRSLIDPANPMGRSSPQSEHDLVIAAKHNLVLAFDNLSNIKPAIADALCRISTGGGFGTRKMYSDSEEVIFDATRPIILNGIPDLATRPDLAERSIIVHLPSIPASERKYESEFWNAFYKAAPHILAGLLDAVSVALNRIDAVILPERPRMADFAKWATAAESGLGWPDGAFMESYKANLLSVEEAAIDGNPVAEAILCFVAEKGDWSGTATQLMKVLRIGYPMLTDDPLSFPRQANRFAGEMRRVQTLLRGRGVEIEFNRQGNAGTRGIKIRKVRD